MSQFTFGYSEFTDDTTKVVVLGVLWGLSFLSILGGIILYLILEKSSKKKKVETKYLPASGTTIVLGKSSGRLFAIPFVLSILLFFGGFGWAFVNISILGEKYKDEPVEISELTDEQKYDLGLQTPYSVDTKKVDEDGQFEFYSTPERAFNENEIKALKSILNKVPQELKDDCPEKVKIISYKDNPFGSYMAAGLTIGDEIYLSNETFNPDNSYPTLNHIIIHELVHVAQFNNVPQKTISKRLGNNQFIDLDKDSELLDKYIEMAGWVETDNGESFVIDTELDLHNNSDYGKDNGPSEDMAEAISYYLNGYKSYLSEGRVSWIEEYFSEDVLANLYIYPYIEGFTSVTAIPEIEPGDYYSAYKPYSHEKNTVNFTENLDKEKEVAGGKYQMALYAIYQWQDPKKYDELDNFFKDQLEFYGWQFEEKKDEKTENGVKFKTLVFKGPKEVITLTVEDRRGFTNIEERKALERQIREFKSYGIDESYDEQRLERFKEKESIIKGEGIYITLNWGLDL